MAVAMRKEAGAVGVLICGSGMGMSMAINRHFGMRGALCRNALDASFSRMHNDANVLVLGARFSPFDEVQEMFEIFLSTEFQGGRHRRRIEKIEVLI
jgi:ribose 5-phosphate isomerase B